MNKFIKKFFEVERAVAHEKGAIALLILLEWEEFSGRWKMVISAKWLPENTREILQLVMKKMEGILTAKEYSLIAKIILLRPYESFVQAFEQLLEEHPQQRELIDVEVNGFAIKRAYVITPQIVTVEDALMEALVKLLLKQNQLETEVRSLRELISAKAPMSISENWSFELLEKQNLEMALLSSSKVTRKEPAILDQEIDNATFLNLFQSPTEKYLEESTPSNKLNR